MSSTTSESALPAVPAEGIQTLLQDSRIDAAHPIGQQTRAVSMPPSDAAFQSDTGAAIADSSPELHGQQAADFVQERVDLEQLQRQAEQLAHFLRERQRELDHREAQLNAELAILETELRKERLCLTERQADLAERARRLDAREREILERLDRLAAADAALRRKAEAETEHCRSPVAEPLESLEIARRSAEEERRHEDLEKAEKRLAEAQREIREFQQKLVARRGEFEEEMHRERQALVVRQRQGLADLEKKRATLQRRGAEIDRCRAGLLDLRAELQRMHRETLETRLATEELWLKLSGGTAPAALTRSMSRIRNRLADHYQQANSELAKRKEELENLRDQLVEQFRNLAQQKRELQRGVVERQQDAQCQGSEITAREQALFEQQARFEQQTQQWQIERMQYEQEIRHLRLELARQVRDAAVA
jgi:hypothetical protein